MRRAILTLLCMGLVGSAMWLLLLGIAAARSDSGFADYGPLLALGIFLFGAGYLVGYVNHHSN
jgi:hypothetical protein